MKTTFLILLLIMSQQTANAGCDPTKFRWGCDMYANVKQKRESDNLIYCGSTRLYVSKQQFAMLERYQRAGIYTHLLVNDVFYDGPCLPQDRKEEFQRPYRF